MPDNRITVRQFHFRPALLGYKCHPVVIGDMADRSPARPDDRCPTCGAPITGIVADGPATYRLEACGHDAGLLTVQEVAATTSPIATDVGTIAPTSPAPGESVVH